MEHNLLMDAIIVENDKFAKLLIAHGADLTYKVVSQQAASHASIATRTEGRKGGR